MKNEINIIFEALRNKEITIDEAERHMLESFESIERYVILGKREVSLSQEFGNIPFGRTIQY